jgi:hypothetical protein
MLKANLVVAALACLVADGVSAQEKRKEQETGVERGEVALSNDTIQLRYITSAERVNVGGGTASAAFFLSEQRDIVLSGDLLFPADLGFFEWLSFDFGPAVYAALLEDDNSDVLAISVGTEVRLEIDRSNRLAVVGRAFYAPDILTFGSADNLTDLSARVEIQVAPRLLLFAGMRWFEFDLTLGDGERTLQEEVFVGVGWDF